MSPKNKADRHVLKVIIKLILLGATVQGSHILFTWLLNKFLFRLHKSIPVAVSLIPCVSFLIYLLRNKEEIPETSVHCRYSPFCSFYFVHQNKPVKSRNIYLKHIKSILKPCDIILRRNTDYLVELIFTQNSYFTHVGICVPDGDDHLKIIDCTSEHGVEYNDIEDFCSCNNLAILRFAVDDSALKATVRESLQAGWEKEAMWKYNNHTEKEPENKDLKNREQDIHNGIIAEIKSGTSTTASINKLLANNNYKQVIQERARSLEGASFDINFDFKSFDKFSCIEYVWYCFRCLYPLHRIKVSDFEYFQFITVPVIMPDVFIKNPFFEYKYTSLPRIDNKQKLQKHVQTKQRQVTKFIMNIAVWDVVILCALKIFLRYRSKR